MENQTMDRLLSEKEVAKMIGMSVSYLQHGRCYGAIQGRDPGPTPIKIGRSVRYRYA